MSCVNQDQVCSSTFRSSTREYLLMILMVSYFRFEIMDRFDIRPHIPPHHIRLLFGPSPSCRCRAEGTESSARSNEPDAVTQLVHDGLLRFGENRKLHNPFLHRRDPIVKHPDGA